MSNRTERALAIIGKLGLAIFRTPKMWGRMAAAAWEIHRNLNNPAIES
jgi:hypothetical protein